jgi:hypothetical protein
MSWIKNNIQEDVANYLFNIKINSLPTRIGLFQRDVRQDIDISFDDLEKQLEETPEMIAFYDQLLAEQRMKLNVLLRRKDILRGRITKQMLEEARNTDVKVRSTDLKDMINADPTLIDLDKDIIVESRIEEKVRSVVRVLQIKSEHLRSLAGFKKEERRSLR